ncbi:MAG: type II secretion system protein GspE, partial [Candidatus Hydrothermarchaeota archaeon]
MREVKLDEVALRRVSARLGIPFQEVLRPEGIDSPILSRLPISAAKKYKFAPLRVEGDVLVLATANPLDLETIDELRFLLGKRVRIVAAPEREVIRAINLLYDQERDTPEQVVQEMVEEEEAVLSELEETEDLLDDVSEAPVIKLVNLLLSQAVRARASDIHIEPYQREVKVRYRIDGVLYNMHTLPKRFHSAITSRVKVMAKLDIAERRLPQDGRIMIKIGDRDVDIRVSIIPTTFGERVVLRLLDKRSIFYSLEEIGLSPEKLELMNRIIRGANGIILVTGPTGSGKTTTLYAALEKINSPDKNIITIEDPVEYQLPGIGQIQVNPKIGLTFANGLRSIVRQDPDVILVGEIRDLETAEIAIHAALTGHLVFSTLHTNDAPGAITRLIDMGIEPFLVASALVAVIAQRLVRTICPYCREPYQPEKGLLREVGLDPSELEGKEFYRGKGCSECFGTGYRGRTGIFEILQVDDAIRSLILRTSDSATIKARAIKRGMATLRDDGI